MHNLMLFNLNWLRGGKCYALFWSHCVGLDLCICLRRLARTLILNWCLDLCLLLEIKCYATKLVAHLKCSCISSTIRGIKIESLCVERSSFIVPRHLDVHFVILSTAIGWSVGIPTAQDETIVQLFQYFTRQWRNENISNVSDF